MPPVLRRWHRPTLGISFIVTVATESLAALAAALVAADGEPWLALTALVLLGLGLAACLWVLGGVDLSQLALWAAVCAATVRRGLATARSSR